MWKCCRLLRGNTKLFSDLQQEKINWTTWWNWYKEWLSFPHSSDLKLWAYPTPKRSWSRSPQVDPLRHELITNGLWVNRKERSKRKWCSWWIVHIMCRIWIYLTGNTLPYIICVKRPAWSQSSFQREEKLYKDLTDIRLTATRCHAFLSQH